MEQNPHGKCGANPCSPALSPSSPWLFALGPRLNPVLSQPRCRLSAWQQPPPFTEALGLVTETKASVSQGQLGLHTLLLFVIVAALGPVTARCLTQVIPTFCLVAVGVHGPTLHLLSDYLPCWLSEATILSSL